jgi:hypothetical protein
MSDATVAATRAKKANYQSVEVNGQKVVEVTLKVLVPEDKIAALEGGEKKVTRTAAVQAYRDGLAERVKPVI